MKNLFLLLLAINLSYFFWQMTGQQNISNSSATLGLETLSVIPDEALAKKNTGDKEQALKSVAGKLADQCYQIAGYEAKRQAEELVEVLTVIFPAIKQQLKVKLSTEFKVDYWVIYPAAKTWQQSQLNAQMIQQKGVKDFWLLSSGEKKGVVSLGLFNDSGVAQARVKDLKERGLTTILVNRRLEKAIYGVFLRLTAKQGGLGRLMQRDLATKQLKMQEINC